MTTISYRYESGSQPLAGYTIQYALGRGGFGEVYFAISDAGREVALKAVQNYKQIELRGIRHCMNLKSSHLVMIFDVKIADDGVPWVIMEYIAGPSLREILDDFPSGLNAQQATFFVRELARGLADLHAAGIVHRDLKPHNIFFENGIVKIGDYSLSKAMTASHRSGHTMTVGSVHYMAPEISMGRYDKTVDIYALGVILYEMLSGRPPFTGESVGEILMKHLQSQPDLSTIEEPFASVVGRAMQRDPSDRYQSTSEMAAALADLQGNVAVDDSITPPSLSMIGTRSREQRRQQAKDDFSLSDTFVSPTALRDTNRVTVDPVDPVDPSPLGWLSDLINIEGGFVDRAVSVCLAYCSSVLLLLIAISGFMSPADTLAVAFFIVLAAVLSRWFFLAIPICRSESPSSRHWYARIVRQLLSLVPLVMAFAIVTDTMSNREVNALGTCFLGLASSLLIIDWVILVSPRRQKLIAWLPTVVIGIIVAVVSLMGRGDDQSLVFDTAVAIATALSLQIVSPLSKRSVEHTSEKPTNGRKNQTADSNNTVDVSAEQMQSGEVSV